MSFRVPFPHCPVCGAPPGQPIGTFDCTGYPHYADPLPKTLSWLACGRCGHIHTDSYWSAEGLDLLLSKTHGGQRPAGNLEQKRLVWAPVVQAVFARMQEKGRSFDDRMSWLDVGCGDGGLVMTAAEFGFDAVGLDARAEVVEAMKALGYQAVQADFLHSQASNPLQVISMADVLEHMPFPVPALRKAHAMLEPGGILYISCPNTDCAAWREMERARANPYWVEMEHVHNFSRRLLMRVLRECGYEPLHYAISTRYRAGMEIISRRQ